MSWSRRTALLAGLTGLALTGCGFAPVHQGGGVQGQFALSAPQTPMGYALLARLEDRLGPPRAPAYHLAVALSTQDAREDSAGHRTLLGEATWTLTGPVQASGTLRHFASYLANDSTVSGEAARRDAETRLAQGLADRITTAVRAALP